MVWITKPLLPNFGVEVFGANLINSLGNEENVQLRHLLDKHSLLVFRGQNLAEADQVRVLNTFGKVSDEQGDGVFHSFVSNVRPDGLFGDRPMLFHQDYGTWHPTQPPVLSLYGQELEGPTLPTMFASLIGGYASLPLDLRSRIANLKVVHTTDVTIDRGKQGYANPRIRLLEFPVMPSESTHPRMAHPLVRPHPRTGAPMLFASEWHTSHVEGYDSASSEEILQEIFSRLYAPTNVWAHHWSLGDLVIWDNLAMQHGRRAVEGAEEVQFRRTLRRVVVCDKPTREIFKNTGFKNSKGFKVVQRA